MFKKIEKCSIFNFFIKIKIFWINKLKIIYIILNFYLYKNIFDKNIKKWFNILKQKK